MGQDHPRGCGENLHLDKQPVIPARITPADAGKTMSSSSAAAKRWDHPRGCGENAACIGWYFVVSGSPPRMRGKLGSSFFTAPNCRITPADAGKTSVCIICNIFAWDHPRGCGENLKVALCGPVQTGSPPRMRGKPRCDIQKGEKTGITPADAGKTLTA